jgi:hypothetical protein
MLTLKYYFESFANIDINTLKHPFSFPWYNAYSIHFGLWQFKLNWYGS